MFGLTIILFSIVSLHLSRRLGIKLSYLILWLFVALLTFFNFIFLQNNFSNNHNFGQLSLYVFNDYYFYFIIIIFMLLFLLELYKLYSQVIKVFRSLNLLLISLIMLLLYIIFNLNMVNIGYNLSYITLYSTALFTISLIFLFPNPKILLLFDTLFILSLVKKISRTSSIHFLILSFFLASYLYIDASTTFYN